MENITHYSKASITQHPVIAYTQLDDAEKDFRLVRLKPRSYQPSPSFQGVEVYCTLETVKHHKDHPYIAISYAWGTDTQTRPISIGGQLCELSINLEEAIRELRDDHADILLWCDQLCINQHDDSEKSFQVQRMKDIYSNAVRVVAWLGSSSNDSDLCIMRLNAISQNPLREDHEALAKILEDYDDQEQVMKLKVAFDHFCHRSYWKRLWILQEFAVAKEALVACGSSRIRSEDLQEALWTIGWIRPWVQGESKFSAEFVRRCYSLRNAFDPPNSDSFVYSVTTCRSRYNDRAIRERNFLLGVMDAYLTLEVDYNHPECSDSRDRVFSLLGLVKDATDFSMFPDYSKTGEEIYEELTRQFLRQGRFDILSYCQFPRIPRNREMATWAPDWHMPTRRPCVGSLNTNERTHFSPSGESGDRQQVEYPDLERLSLLGIHVDTVEAIGCLWDPDWLKPLEPQETLKYFGDILKFCLKSDRIKSDEPSQVDRDVARIAIGDLYYAQNPGVQMNCLKHYQQLVEFLQQKVSENPPSPKEEARVLADDYAATLKRLHSRRIIITNSGYVCLAPHHVMPENEICIILGCRAAYAIRPIGSGEYSLVGETYVHGAMYGECMQNVPHEKRYILR
jgi:hypothetical protein